MKKIIVFVSFVSVCFLSIFLFPQQSRTHELKLVPENVHWGYYDAKVKPVLRINPGDTVRVETMVARGIDRLKLVGVPDEQIPESLKAVERVVTDRGPGAHPMTGPIYVEGAQPGDSLEVKILGRLGIADPYRNAP